MSWCARPEHFANVTVSVWRNISGQRGDECSILDADWDRITFREDLDLSEYNMTECEEWEFDQDVFQSTITSDFSLVCGRGNVKLCNKFFVRTFKLMLF